MRKSGILMHITSLPGPYGIGSMGKRAYEFVDFLAESGQSYWQLLPLSPTGYGDSPYQAFSAFAGNPHLIDLDTLIDEGLLLREEAESVQWGDDPGRVDFGALYENRAKVLRLAFDRFEKTADYHRFVLENADWLEDYGLFMALKEAFRGKPWQSWSISLMMRMPEVLQSYGRELKRDIEFQYFQQYQFFRQWKALRTYANSRGIRVIGDVPIYVPLDSADVWANAQLFCLDQSCRPIKVAGCPPDSFSEDGQLWGNPIYDWEKMKADGYRWWLRRLKAAQRMYDVVRLDHFRGFESFWSIPAQDKTARNGVWEKGPGMDFIRAVQEKKSAFRIPNVLHGIEIAGPPHFSGPRHLIQSFRPDGIALEITASVNRHSRLESVVDPRDHAREVPAPADSSDGSPFRINTRKRTQK